MSVYQQVNLVSTMNSGVLLPVLLGSTIADQWVPCSEDTTNVWVLLAHTALSASTFCLPHTVAVEDLMETCFLGISTPLNVLQNYTLLKSFQIHATC